MCTAIHINIISTVNDLIDAGFISLFWGSKARWGALKRKEFIFIFVTSSTQTNMLLANISRELVKVEYLVHQLSISLFQLSINAQCTNFSFSF